MRLLFERFIYVYTIIRSTEPTRGRKKERVGGDKGGRKTPVGIAKVADIVQPQGWIFAIVEGEIFAINSSNTRRARR
jgi:hypothetical protein